MLARLARILAVLGLALLLVLVAAFGFVQTGFARQQIETALERSLTGQGQKAEVSGLGGLLPFAVRLERLRLSDDRGTWLEVDKAHADLAPTALLAGRVEVRELGAERIALERLPQTPAAAEPAPAVGVPELPALPETLPPVRVERLSVPRLELGAPLLGRAAVLAVEGRAGVEGDGRRLAARLGVERIDERTAELALDAALDLAARTLELKLLADERGGLVAAATGLERAGPARLRLEGGGPLARWQGSLDAAVEGLGKLDGRLALALEGLPGVDLALEGELAPDGLPAPILAALGTRPEAALALLPEGPRRLRLDRLRLSTPALALEGGGLLDLDGDRIEARISGDAPDLGRLAPLLGTPLAGTARLSLEAAGAASRPEATLRIEGEELAFAEIAARRLGVELVSAPSLPGFEPAGLVVGLEARAEGASLAGTPLGPEGLVTLDGEATIPPEGPARIAALRLRALDGLVWLAGELDPRTLRGELGYGFRLDDLRSLAPIAPGAALPGGAVEAQGVARLAGPERIDAELAVVAQELADLPAGLADLLGRNARLDGRLALADGRLRVEDLALVAARAKAEGGLGLDLADRRLSGTLRLELRELAALSGLAGTPLAGSATLETRLAGTLAAPELALAATADAPAFGPVRLDRLRLDGKAALAAARTSFALDAVASLAADELRLAGAGRLEGERLELERLRLDGLGLGLDGRASADLTRPLVSGRLAGRAEDLARLRPLGLEGFSGAVELEATAEVEAGRQNAKLRLLAARVGGAFGDLAAGRVELSGRDLSGRGSVTGEAVVEDFASPDLAIERARLGLDGPLAELGFALEAKGSQAGKPLALQGNGRLAALSEPRRLELAKLTGELAGQSIELRQPARITLDKGVLDLGTIDLKIGDATARTRASWGGGQIRAGADLQRLRLADLAALGAPALPGIASATLELSGPTRAPEGRFTLRLDELLPANAGTAPARVELGLQLKAGRELLAEARATGLGPEPIVAETRLPVRVDLDAPMFAPEPGAALRGSARGRVDLARLEPLLALDGQRIAGTAELDLRLAGRLEAPVPSGRIRIARGEFRDAVSGLVVRELEAVLVGRDGKLVVQQLQGRDRGEGRLQGTGEVALAELAWKVRLEAAAFQVLANELGSAVVSGTAEANGRGAEGALKARLEVDRAEIRIPDPAPAVPATIPVEEIGRGARAEIEPAAAPPPPFALDVRVRAENQIFVRGRGLESEWFGDVRARGTLAEPDVVGRIELRRGRLDLLGSRFVLKEGLIEFDGAKPPMPRLDVVGEARKADITAKVGLRGRAPKFDIVMESEPPLPRDEILARVLFGREMARITPIQAAVLANSVATLQGGGIDALSPVRGAIGLDTLDVGGDDNGGAAVRAGKYVTERVYVEMQRGVTPESSRARVEVDLGNNLRGTTEVRETGRTGFGLEWRYDY